MKAIVAAVIVGLAAPAAADGSCHIVDVAFTPTDGLQIVGWVEQADGTYVDTLYITKKTGHYGLGNRPGRFDFNSGPPPSAGHDSMWPYGRRITTFPVWAHRHGMTFPEVDFQLLNGQQHECCGNENDLSQEFQQSSLEHMPYCRPLNPSASGTADKMMWDTSTCATTANTDKGIFNPSVTSLYPPRADLIPQAEVDSPSVAMYRAINPFDAVSQATPVGGQCTQITWPIPPALAAGSYVLWLEVSSEFDFNSSYNSTTLPPPCGGSTMPCTMPTIPFYNYGMPYRGQPSVVYSVPFTVGAGQTMTAAQSYGGYGDPNGVDGTVRPPDTTITTDTPGSGGSRLMLIPGTSDRVEVSTKELTDPLAPAAPGAISARATGSTVASVKFSAPGDDGMMGSVSGYDIRILANDELTADNFVNATPVSAIVSPGSGSTCGNGGFPAAGTDESFELTGLMPVTDYWVGVRAFDKCHNYGPLAIAHFSTPEPQGGEVGWCFVATAAYGTAMANDVDMLRRFRDVLLEKTVVGELAVETYYTFGPSLAGVVGESDMLREAARDLLRPLVERVRRLAF